MNKARENGFRWKTPSFHATHVYLKDNLRRSYVGILTKLNTDIIITSCEIHGRFLLRFDFLRTRRVFNVMFQALSF